jgi:GxxExxY protein
MDEKHTKMRLVEPDSELEQLSSVVLGAAIEVHKVIGPGYLESIYEEALSIELDLRGVSVFRQYSVDVYYKTPIVGQGKLDLLVNNRLIVELKSVDAFLPIHVAQVISYLKATRCMLGLLINFNVPVMKHGIRRVIYTDPQLQLLAEE